MAPSMPPLAFDDIAIDFAGRRLLRGGIEQSLEPKAFGVLALLTSTPGRVFPRDEILDAVWGHRHVTPGVLNRVMTLLRHALGEDAHGARYLHTVHGVGYRFDLPATGVDVSPSAPAVMPESKIVPARAPMRRAGDGSRAFSRVALRSLPVLAALAFAAWTWWPRASPAPTATATATVPSMERSIAVLPLLNASRDADQQFFSDGLSDNLIDALSRFEGLKVIGRTSSFQFRDSKDDSASIGRKLGVAYLFNGSVQRAGDVVRISTSLTKAADGSTLWAEHYDRPYKDLFALQDEIASAVARALRAKLLSSDSAAKQGDRPPNGNMEAYDAYLQGMQSFYRGNHRREIEFQTQATRIDPAYAAAWSQLSIAWALLGYSQSGDEAQISFRNARIAVQKALALQPELGIAHGALGNLLLGGDFDWKGALSELRRGSQLAPDNGPIHGGLSRALAASGHLGEALEERERFMSFEPLQAAGYFLYADLLIAAGQLDEAENNLRSGEELMPHASPAYQRVYVAILRNDARTARDVAGRLSPPWRDMNLAVAMQIGPDRAAADAALAKVVHDKAWAKTTPYLIAQAYALRSDADQTMAWLERTWAARDPRIHHLLHDPLILRFRDDPRLIAFCKKIGLPPPSESEALSIDQIRASLAAKR